MLSCPFPKGTHRVLREGHEVESYLVRWRGHLQSKASLQVGTSSAPKGAAGVGFYHFALQSRHAS